MTDKGTGRSAYPELAGVSRQTASFFGNRRNIAAFLAEIVKQGGDMLAAEALGYGWPDVNRLYRTDDALRALMDEQAVSVARKAEQLLCNRAMHGFEEIVEEHGEVVKKSRKFNDKILLDYVKANNPKYRKDAGEDGMPTVEIRRFEVPPG